MNTQVTCIIVFCLALVNAGIVAVPLANILEGPSTRTKIIGPDGSSIDAYAPGGKIVLDNNVGPLIQTAPLVLAQQAIAEPQLYAPVELHPTVLVEPIQQINDDSNDIEVTVARISEEGEKALVQPEPSARAESRASAQLTEETEETSIATTELSYTTDTSEEIETTPNLSGAYVQDNIEKLYDDGSYRSEHF